MTKVVELLHPSGFTVSIPFQEPVSTSHSFIGASEYFARFSELNVSRLNATENIERTTQIIADPPFIDPTILETKATIDAEQEQITVEYMNELEKITREYEDHIEPLLKQSRLLQQKIPRYWARALHHCEILSAHVALTDTDYLDSIVEVSARRRPRAQDGFVICIKLNEKYKSAYLLRSYVLSKRFKIADKRKDFAILDDETEKLFFNTVGVISLPTQNMNMVRTSTSRDFNQSHELYPDYETQEEIKQCSFFHYFLNEMSLDEAEYFLHTFIPYSFVFYSKDEVSPQIPQLDDPS